MAFLRTVSEGAPLLSRVIASLSRGTVRQLGSYAAHCASLADAPPVTRSSGLLEASQRIDFLLRHRLAAAEKNGPIIPVPDKIEHPLARFSRAAAASTAIAVRAAQIDGTNYSINPLSQSRSALLDAVAGPRTLFHRHYRDVFPVIPAFRQCDNLEAALRLIIGGYFGHRQQGSQGELAAFHRVYSIENVSNPISTLGWNAIGFFDARVHPNPNVVRVMSFGDVFLESAYGDWAHKLFRKPLPNTLTLLTCNDYRLTTRTLLSDTLETVRFKIPHAKIVILSSNFSNVLDDLSKVKEAYNAARSGEQVVLIMPESRTTPHAKERPYKHMTQNEINALIDSTSVLHSLPACQSYLSFSLGDFYHDVSELVETIFDDFSKDPINTSLTRRTVFSAMFPNKTVVDGQAISTAFLRPARFGRAYVQEFLASFLKDGRGLFAQDPNGVYSQTPSDKFPIIESSELGQRSHEGCVVSCTVQEAEQLLLAAARPPLANTVHKANVVLWPHGPYSSIARMPLADLARQPAFKNVPRGTICVLDLAYLNGVVGGDYHNWDVSYLLLNGTTVFCVRDPSHLPALQPRIMELADNGEPVIVGIASSAYGSRFSGSLESKVVLRENDFILHNEDSTLFDDGSDINPDADTLGISTFLGVDHIAEALSDESIPDLAGVAEIPCISFDPDKMADALMKQFDGDFFIWDPDSKGVLAKLALVLQSRQASVTYRGLDHPIIYPAGLGHLQREGLRV